MTTDDQDRTVTITLVPILEGDREIEQQVLEQRNDFDELDFDDVRRKAMASIVRTALLNMAEKPEEWLANGSIRTKDKIGMFVLWNIGYIDDEVLRLRAEAEDHERIRLANLRRLAESSGPD
jgi:hypothetical protein